MWRLAFLLLSLPCFAQTVNTSCTLYPNAAYCTSTSDGGHSLVVEQQRQQYQAGYAVGSAIGLKVFYARFPGWRRGYCSKHPEQPFHYGNAQGNVIRGTCPTFNALANEAAAEFRAKHYSEIKSPEEATAIDKYIADNQLPPWEPKSYEKAAKALKKS